MWSLADAVRAGEAVHRGRGGVRVGDVVVLDRLEHELVVGVVQRPLQVLGLLEGHDDGQGGAGWDENCSTWTWSAVICADAGMSSNATTAGTFFDPPTAILPPEVLPTSKAPPNATMARKTPKIKRMRLLFGLTSVANRLTS